jgi:hypothetical protein
MMAQKRRGGGGRGGGYWRSVSDDHLLSVELMIDDPMTLENLVFAVPEGDEEPYIEFVYDQRKSGRDKFHCVHGNHPHLFGCVMNKGGKRFLVGWICGKEIYGEDFRRFRKDYDYARDRQELLRRVREVKAVIDLFVDWMGKMAKDEVFNLYESVGVQLTRHVPWLRAQLERHTNYGGGMLYDLKLPATLFDGFTSPRKSFREAAAEIAKCGALLIGKAEIEKDVEVTLGRMQKLLKQLEGVLDQLKEVEDFFQPAMLVPICEWATESHDPNRIRYTAGMASITCHRDSGPITVRMPQGYRMPDREPIRALRAALSGLG